MSGQKPLQGWIYKINPHSVSLQCRSGHIHLYELKEPGEFVNCKQTSCTLEINSSRVFRGYHPYIIWTGDQFQNESSYIQTFTVIPLTSKETYKGLPTTYPVNSTSKNGLEKTSYALVHQICTVEANCFKDSEGNWLQRIGQLGKEDRTSIQERLKYFLGIKDVISEDWLANNSSPELVEKILDYLPEDTRILIIEKLIDNLNLNKRE